MQLVPPSVQLWARLWALVWEHRKVGVSEGGSVDTAVASGLHSLPLQSHEVTSAHVFCRSSSDTLAVRAEQAHAITSQQALTKLARAASTAANPYADTAASTTTRSCASKPRERVTAACSRMPVLIVSSPLAADVKVSAEVS